MKHPSQKTQLHPRNRHRECYDFELLCKSFPELKPFVIVNAFGDTSIDFFNAAAVKMLNRALLKHYYNIAHWNIPDTYLIPPIPGRADYIHQVADLLATGNNGTIPRGSSVKCLDIGTGANLIYPIIGVHEYGWSFTGSDIDPLALDAAGAIVKLNPSLKGKVALRLQLNTGDIFKGILHKGEQFDVSICNPPFHASAAEAKAGTLRKLSNLKGRKITRPALNFGGTNNELWCDGGEVKFIRTMITESREFATSCKWFTTLVAKQTSLGSIYDALTKAQVKEVKTIAMAQGNKSSRIVAWSYLQL
ncbi:MAG: 23S rRNA (adenine(1618)-N(6))-methyltransferase RlmF [Bacteroidia bacterium]